MTKKFTRKAKALLARSTVGKAASSLLGPEANPEKWVFMIGCYNSGTSLLHTIFSNHPDIASLPTEGAFITNSMKTPESFRWVRMWYKCIAQIEQDENTPESAARRIKRNWGFWYNRSKSVFLEKSISNAARIKFLDKYFQPAYFIYIVRNGYAVAEGIRRKSSLKRHDPLLDSERYPIEMCAKQWLESDRYISICSAGFRHFKRIKYEDLTEKPDFVMVDLCRFIGISPKPLLNISQQTLDVVGYRSRIKNMNASSIKRLSTKDLKAIEYIAGEHLKGYGYQMP